MLYFLVHNFLRQMTCYCKCLLGYGGWHNYYVRRRQHIFTIHGYKYVFMLCHSCSRTCHFSSHIRPVVFTDSIDSIIIEIHVLTITILCTLQVHPIALINWLSCLWTCVLSLHTIVFTHVILSCCCECVGLCHELKRLC